MLSVQWPSAHLRQLHAAPTTRGRSLCSGDLVHVLGARLSIAGVTVSCIAVTACANFVRRSTQQRGRRLLLRLLCSADSNARFADEGRPVPEGEKVSSELDDAFLNASLQLRVKQLKIERNWIEGQATCKVVVCADDWVRRVSLHGQELFVGTASKGIRRYLLGDDKPRQSFNVMGDPRNNVPADHPCLVDPETSVTSLIWDGCYLAAGLASGRVHLWHDDGTLLLNAPVWDEEDAFPCYVNLNDGFLYAASGCSLLRWQLETFARQEQGSQPIGELQNPAAAITIDLDYRVHCLTIGQGCVALGLDGGFVEIRCIDSLELLARWKTTTKAAVSAICFSECGLLTGDAEGQVCSWRLDIKNPKQEWALQWSAKHMGRVVSIQIGGGNSVVTGGLDGKIRVWDMVSGDCKLTIPNHRVWLGSICITDDYGIMVTDGRDNQVYMYDFTLDDPDF